MDVIINGYCGQMGQVLEEVLLENSVNIVARVDRTGVLTKNGLEILENIKDFKGRADIVIDFSHPSSLPDLLDFSKVTNTGLVVATTGLDNPSLKSMEDAAKETKIFHSSNMSLGINLLLDLVNKAASVLDGYDIEILEAHHNKKIDSPSGTAYMIANSINKAFDNEKVYTFGRHSNSQKRSDQEIGIHAIRGGTVVGEHTSLFLGEDEILEIKHSAHSKKVFAKGALAASKFLLEQGNGLYTMDDLIK